jgi:hypothetical protein
MNCLRGVSLFFILSALIHAPFAQKVRADASLRVMRERIRKEHSEIPPEALTKALNYYEEHAAQVTNKNYITIIDFDQPSTDYRMHVIEMSTGDVSSYLVAHGKNSGELYADYFSNAEGSLMSSLGIYLTGIPYIGEHGLSMRLLGQESSNSNAYAREIVLHGATYVSEAFIQSTGRLGRSDGCTAVEVPYASGLVNELDNGSVLLIYKK